LRASRKMQTTAQRGLIWARRITRLKRAPGALPRLVAAHCAPTVVVREADPLGLACKKGEPLFARCETVSQDTNHGHLRRRRPRKGNPRRRLVLQGHRELNGKGFGAADDHFREARVQAS
jgi:hypothetical protein